MKTGEYNVRRALASAGVDDERDDPTPEKAPETPPTEPKPTPIQDPPPTPVTPPLVVRRAAAGDPINGVRIVGDPAFRHEVHP